MNTPTILPATLLALCTLSCCTSQHDGPSVPEDKPDITGISFSSANDSWQDAATTRANTGLETMFRSFRVWGYKNTDATQTVMDGYDVEYKQDSNASTTTNTDGWEYVGIKNHGSDITQTIKYWDFSATNYRFFAYSPKEAQVKIEKNSPETSNETISFTFPYEYSDDATAKAMPYASDLWFSDNISTENKYGKCVKLSFAPIIAKVRFKFAYPDGTEEMMMKSIAFRDSRFIDDPTTADTPLRGTITVTYPTTSTPTSTSPQHSWTTATENATGNIILTIPYEAADDKIHVVDDQAQYEKWYYVPPLAIIPYEQGPYTITAIIDGNETSATVPAEFMQWNPGYQYTYIFKITEAGTVITFNNVQVEQWLPGSDIDNNGKGTEGW